MHRYHCLVSRSSTRNPAPQYVHAQDEAEAAASFWDKPTWPTVRPSGPISWTVSDGMTTYKVQILGKE
jgi:hypothetical protein